jgi:26S proteasome regulatory subunit N10
LWAKTQSNPENTVGIMTTMGKGVRVLVTPTSDFGNILASMHGLEVGGEMNLTSSVQIAQLALKHHQNNKNNSSSVSSCLLEALLNPIKIFLR